MCECVRAALCAHARSRNGTSTLFLRNGLVGSHFASEGKPYCVTLLASGLHSLPLVTLTGAWTHRGLWLVYHNNQPSQKLRSSLIIVILPFVLIRNIAAAYLWVKTCSVCVCFSHLKCFRPICGALFQQLVIIGWADEIQADLSVLQTQHSSYSILAAVAHTHTSVLCFYAVRYILKREIWAYCTLKIFNNLISFFQTTDMN